MVTRRFLGFIVLAIVAGCVVGVGGGVFGSPASSSITTTALTTETTIASAGRSSAALGAEWTCNVMGRIRGPKCLRAIILAPGVPQELARVRGCDRDALHSCAPGSFHSRNRILHANGDATGREIAVSLLRHARQIPSIRLMEWATGIDLIVAKEGPASGRVIGATLLDGEVTATSDG